MTTSRSYTEAEIEALFPRQQTFAGLDLYKIGQMVLEDTIGYLMGEVFPSPKRREVGLVPSVPSIGGFISNLKYAGRYHEVWDQPEEFIGCYLGFGLDQYLLAYNAARMARAVARTGKISHLIPASRVRNPVGSAVGKDGQPGDLRWGDFGTTEKVFGGAVILGTGKSQVMVGLNGLKWPQDFGGSAIIAGVLVPLLEEATS